MSILVVDDSSESRALLMQFLQTAGHEECIGLESADMVFNYLGLKEPSQCHTAPDLILMDVLMPDINGLEACKTIKGTERLHDIPIIMITAKSEAAILQQAFSVGANDYITKPVNRMELLARTNSALALKQEMDRRKLRERELQESNVALQQALKEVKVLRGFIPICASCKKIRNDQGAWQLLEEYLYEHSEAEFSHGICSDCMERLYPGV